MYPVTQAYLDALNQRVREPSFINIVFGVTDPDAPGASTITAPNGELSYSNAAAVDMGSTVPITYATLERNRWVLDGGQTLALATNPIWQGFVGSQISSSSNVYGTQPYLHIVFSDYFEFGGLSFLFDTALGDYPTALRVVAKEDGTTVFDETYNPTSARFSFEDAIPSCNEMDIYAVSSNKPCRRFRISQLVYGLVHYITDDDISSASLSQSTSLLSSELPTCDFEFTIFDSEHRYDPENPQGLWEYLESRQNVTVTIGQYLSPDNDAYEEIPLCTTYTTGEFSVSGQGNLVEVSVKTSGLSAHLTDNYTQGVYEPDGVSLYTLAQRVAAFAGYSGVITIDSALQNITTHIPLPNSPVNECLQLIANAGRCIMTHSRGGYLQIIRADDDPTDFSLTFDGMLSEPEVSKIPKLKKVITSYQRVSVATETTNAVDAVSITASTATQFTLDHSGAFTNCAISVSSGLTIVGTAAFYAYCTVVTLQGSGTVTVTGKALEFTEVSYEKTYGTIGEDLDSMTNELIDSAAVADAYADWVAENTMRRTTYSTENRGYPYIDVGDMCEVDSNFATGVDATIVSDRLTYNGTISGSTEFVTATVED